MIMARLAWKRDWEEENEWGLEGEKGGANLVPWIRLGNSSVGPGYEYEIESE